ncbi:NAD-dependent epimerase/dehydratase family protein [Collimonas pratensis]|uniref:GDP-mannose 4,6-dehydratase n=1 Tax=Collimonas pratensis TaxID=279113 RepID=UPI00143DCC28|nr:GDP-mannose 4,6-dehydratase [Collimonas pratensis]NKI70555.1 NAD-dependent epimerase/dehydratase family protein [Collimonas pratensis]
MKKLFLTGESGFVGRAFYGPSAHAAVACDFELIPANATYDLLDPESLDRVLQHARPDAVIHLAGQTFIPEAFRDPGHTLDVNLKGTLNLLQALQRNNFSGTFLYVSSGDVYGKVTPELLPITEQQTIRPANPYAVSKAAAELLCYQWSCVMPWRILVARPFNHIGPGQREDFVISGVARQLARIRHGLQEPRVLVGDIDVSRDFLDVDDVISAYLALLENGRSGEIYNVCSGKEHLIRDVIASMFYLTEVDAVIEQDPGRLRPSDLRRVQGSNQKIRQETTWQPYIPMQQTLLKVLSDWDSRVAAERRV